MEQIFNDIWSAIVKYYTIYSDFIHSILPGQLGDLAEGLIDIVIVIAIIKIISTFAFGTKGGNN